MNPNLIHLQWIRVGQPEARCYWRVPVAQTTTDPALVTCAKCRRTRTFKDLLPKQPVIHTSGRTDPRWVAMPYASGYLGADHNEWDGAV